MIILVQVKRRVEYDTAGLIPRASGSNLSRRRSYVCFYFFLTSIRDLEVVNHPVQTNIQAKARQAHILNTSSSHHKRPSTVPIVESSYSRDEESVYSSLSDRPRPLPDPGPADRPRHRQNHTIYYLWTLSQRNKYQGRWTQLCHGRTGPRWLGRVPPPLRAGSRDLARADA